MATVHLSMKPWSLRVNGQEIPEVLRVVFDSGYPDGLATVTIETFVEQGSALEIKGADVTIIAVQDGVTNEPNTFEDSTPSEGTDGSDPSV